jgi:hypothetical protein
MLNVGFGYQSLLASEAFTTSEQDRLEKVLMCSEAARKRNKRQLL